MLRAGLPNYLLGGGGTTYPGSRQADVTTCSPRMVTECFLTRSMLIKMYKYTTSWYVPVYIVFTVIQFHAEGGGRGWGVYCSHVVCPCIRISVHL